MRKSFVVFIFLALFLALLAAPAAAASPQPAQPAAALQTPVPQEEKAGSSEGIPWLAIIFFLGVGAIMVWRTTHPYYSKPITEVDGIPLIDEEYEQRIKDKIRAQEEKEAREREGS